MESCILLLCSLRNISLVHSGRQGHFGKDHLVTLARPERPRWMTRQQYEQMPKELTLREVRIRVEQSGFRTKTLVVVTTLTDARKYPRNDIASLYRQRWQVELHLRSLKTILQMDHLRCKTPERIRNEFYMHVLGYNLIRQWMTIGAMESGTEPWAISFKGTLQLLNHFLPKLLSGLSTDLWCRSLLDAIATHTVGNRPDRFEPRLVKRRPKTYKHLREPRCNYKSHMQQTT